MERRYGSALSAKVGFWALLNLAKMAKRKGIYGVHPTTKKTEFQRKPRHTISRDSLEASDGCQSGSAMIAIIILIILTTILT